MSAAKKIIDKKILRELVPLNTLSHERFEEISGKIVIQEVRAGEYLFRIDDRDNQAVFLLGGEVSLLDRNRGPAGRIIAGTDQCRYPIAAAQPRVLSACAAKKCIVARIDASLLEAYLSWDQSNDAEAVVIGADGNEDWMTKMLQSQAFEKIPPAKIQKLLLKMDAVQLKAGTTVIRQGDDGDYFYTIQSGMCAVTRKDTPQAEQQLLAELTNGDCFGEEALVSNIKRNATVSMLTDGVLMRLAKEDFVELLQKPLIRYVEYEKAALMVDEGAVWLDVRSAEEYDNGALEDSVNIPFDTVRGEIPELIFNVSYIICSQIGKSSESAAFILGHKGFDVYVLEGGLSAVPADAPGFALENKSPKQQEPGGKSAASAEPVDHIQTGNTAVVDTKSAAGVDRGGQQAATLHAEKLRLESDLPRMQKQIASLERVVDEQKKLHALDKQQLAKANDENRRLTAAMQDEARRLDSRIAEQAGKIDRLQADKQAAVSALDSQVQGWVRERAFFKSEDDEARQRIADLQKQLDQARETDGGANPDLQTEMEELISKTNKKIENKELQCVELKQGQSRLRSDLKVMRDERDALERRLGKAISETACRQKDIDSLQAQLASVTTSADEQEQALQLQLETMRLLHEDTRRHAADTQAQFNTMQDELGALKAAAARHRQEALAAAGGLEAMRKERDELQQKLAEAADDVAGRQQKIATLEAQLADINRDAEEQLQDARLQLEAMRQQHEDMQRQAADSLVQLSSAQDQLASMETAVARLEQEALLLGQQKEELQRALEQRAGQQDSVQAELEQLLMKANDELTRKNDIEGELQGQIDRLRKKLEQTTAELQESRQAEQTGIDSIREELHAERSARTLERAEMAARQRELKEQLAAVASEHEENLSLHSGAIEQARLQQMRETQLETASRFEELQHELQQAYDEIRALEKREKSRLKEEHSLSRERQRQYEASLEQLHTQL
ncbi:MAG: cyclic nucleotide-binding domain-containing protein, partial [Gammaproteobacteria bacterium]